MNRNEVKRRQAQMVAIILFLINYLLFSLRAGFNGAAYFLVPLFAFWTCMILINGSLINTLSRLIKLRLSKEQVRSCLKLERDSFVFQMIVSVIPCLILIFGAGYLSGVIFRIPLSEMLIRVFAITIIFRCLNTTVLGIAKGENVEFPCITADIFRQFIIFITQIFLCRYLEEYGTKVSELLGLEDYTGMYVGLGFALSFVIAEIFTSILCVVSFLKMRKNLKQKQEGMRTSISFWDNIKTLCGNRIPSMIVLVPVVFPFVVGILFLQKASNASSNLIENLGTMAVAGFVIPGILIALYCISMIPVCGKVVGFLRKDEQKYARTMFQNGVHVGIVKAFFYSVFVAVESSRITGILFDGNAEITGKYLRLASVLILFGCLSYYFAEILILTGKRVVVLITGLALDVVFVFALSVLLNRCEDSIVAFLYSIILCTIILAISLGTIVYKKLRISIDWILYIILPLATAAATGIICMFVDKMITPHLGDLVSFFLCYLISISLYWVLSLVLRGFNSSELEAVPGNRLVIALGQMLHAI